MRTDTARTSARGFSLIELLTVIFIISVLIAILLPALGAVQGSGRQAATQSLLVELNNAAASFELDNRRQPGYFTQEEIGSELNFDPGTGTGPGLTALENALLDLSGVGAIATEAPADPDNWVIVNPTDDTDRQIWVKADLIGADEGNYFIPAESSLVHMSGPLEQAGTITEDEPGNDALPDGLPDVVDAYGTPLIAWVENDNGPRNVRSIADFATMNPEAAADDDTANSGRSRFYWGSNGSMLASRSLGEKGRDMTIPAAANTDGSLIGSGTVGGSNGEDAIRGILSALLGHPGYPDEASLANGDYANLFPKQARGGFIAHSAGEDGIFLGTDDSRFGRLIGSEFFGGGSINISYGIDFFSNTAGNRRRGEDKQPTTRDFIDSFDDTVVAQ